MRRFIVKHFALDYMTIAFGYGFNFTRSATFIYPLVVLAGLVVALDENFPRFDLIDGLAIGLMLIPMFISFVYLRLKPVKLHELDNEQLFQAGEALEQKIIFYEITEEDQKRLFESRKYIQDNYVGKRFYKPWLFIFHPLVITIIALIITLLYLNEY